MKTKNNNQISPQKSDKNSQGFTLVELLVVVAVLMLLIGILGPSVGKALTLAKVRKTEAAISMLTEACKQYEIDFEDFPPSADLPPPGYLGVNEGKQIIVLLLTGYAGDDSDTAAPDTDNFSADDGKTGFGFRTVKRGKVYGPYNGAEKLDAAGDPRVFQDAFDNDILYYRCNGGVYTAGDNTGTDVPLQDYLDACADVRTDFLFLSPGSDGSYITNPANADAIKNTDDITNLE